MYIIDVENLLIAIILCFFFFFSLRKKNNYSGGQLLIIDLNMSKAMKGVACVFILLGHYGQRKNGLVPAGLFSKTVWCSTANIGLVWFMFFSGYGLSLKHMVKEKVFREWWNRLLKVYLPLLFTSVIAIMIYALLPVKYNPSTAKALWIVDEIAAIHDGRFCDWIPSLFGWLDWYVFCIMIFYSLFYLSYYLMKRTGWNQTLILSAMMVLYFVWAYKIFGPLAAQWYRFIWAFLLGHIIARQKSEDKSYMLLLFLPFVGLIFLEGKVMIADYLLAVYGLLLVSVLNRWYEVKGGAPILFLGSISYFYYLCHVRIGYQLMTYMGINDLLFWTLLTVGIAWLLKFGYDRTFGKLLDTIIKK